MVEPNKYNLLSEQIIGSAIEVHKTLGPGLLESAYEACLCHELKLREIPFENQVELPVFYKGVKLDVGYRMDLVVNKIIIVEIKAVEKLEAIREAQLLTYLKLSKYWLGLLINFNVAQMRFGLKRLVLGTPQ